MKKIFAIAAIVCAFALAGCSQAPAQLNDYASLDAYPIADMTKYDCAEGYDKEYQFVNMTVAEVAAEMQTGATFMVYAGFDHCPWCNSILNPMNDIALERGIKIAYIDTRADPAWQSNLDLKDYDLFVELFGSTLDEDDNGIPHLYVPHCFFVKNGVLVGDHAGTVPSQESASDPLTETQLAEYHQIINNLLNQLS